MSSSLFLTRVSSPFSILQTDSTFTKSFIIFPTRQSIPTISSVSRPTRCQFQSANNRQYNQNIVPTFCYRSLDCIAEGFVINVRVRGGKFLVRSNNENGSSGVENFWETPEGIKKLTEIEETKALKNDLEWMEKELTIEDIARENSNKTPEEIEQERARVLREMLAKRARELAEKRRESENLFKMGQKAYGVGEYGKAVKILETSLSKIENSSILGGEIQIWLAMAYDANNRRKDCIEMYKRLEVSHPNITIRRQARDLRYIAEAPKLKLTRDEMITLPLLDKDGANVTWSQMVREGRKKFRKSKSVPDKSYMDLSVWQRPSSEENPYFWVALSVWFCMVIFSVYFQ